MAINKTETVRFSVKGLQDDQAIVNVLYYEPRTLNPAFTSTIEQCLSAFSTMWLGSFLALQSETYSVVQISADTIAGSVVHPDDPTKRKLVYGTDFTSISPAGAVGLVAGAAMPSYVAATIQKKTSRKGRRWRGSLRLGGLVEADTDSVLMNRLTAGSQAAIDAAAELLHQTLDPGGVGDTLVPVILSITSMFEQAQPVLSTENHRQPITATSVNFHVGSQVSRKRKGAVGR